MKQSPLHPNHVALGARLVDFHGWEMPVQYTSILDEHRAVREAAGLFDISHMGEVRMQGPGAGQALNALLTNNVDKLEPGEGQYTMLLNREGGVVDDLILYRVGDDSFFMVINAAKIEEDIAWMESCLGSGNFVFEHASQRYGAVAIQGPKAADVMSVFLEHPVEPLPARNRIEVAHWMGLSLLLARTGYTGEDGFEVFADAEVMPRVWEGLLEQGATMGLKPAGLGARNTLRLEAGLPLNGQDLLPNRTPMEAGLGRFVSTKKAPDFPGKEICRSQREEGVEVKLTGFRMLDRGAPPREHYPLLAEGQAIGEVTSGTMSPTLGMGIGMGYIPTEYASIGRKLEMKVRSSHVEIEVVKKPFYRREES